MLNYPQSLSLMVNIGWVLCCITDYTISASFRQLIAAGGNQYQLCSLKRSEDDETRKHIAEMLTHLAAHGNGPLS
jgi:hypothetical protein